MNHRATPRFWNCYYLLRIEVQWLVDALFAPLRQDSRHPSLRLKKVGRLWSVRVGLHHRALAADDGHDLVWFWIGTHAEYDRILGHA